MPFGVRLNPPDRVRPMPQALQARILHPHPPLSASAAAVGPGVCRGLTRLTCRGTSRDVRRELFLVRAARLGAKTAVPKHAQRRRASRCALLPPPAS